MNPEQQQLQAVPVAAALQQRHCSAGLLLLLFHLCHLQSLPAV
jgi:hypothetical protein